MFLVCNNLLITSNTVVFRTELDCVCVCVCVCVYVCKRNREVNAQVVRLHNVCMCEGVKKAMCMYICVCVVIPFYQLLVV